jgi:hypothetical protein
MTCNRVVPERGHPTTKIGRSSFAQATPAAELEKKKGPVSRAFLGGRTWDRTRPRPKPLAATETHSSPHLQEEEGSDQDDDLPLDATPFHRAVGQPADEDYGPLGSA